jgi:hypothetical protein
MTTIHTHNEGIRECVVSFPTNDDMDRAIGVLTYESDDGFTGIDERTIEISTEQCQMLKSKGDITYNHIE